MPPTQSERAAGPHPIVLLVDGNAHTRELFAEALGRHLGLDVRCRPHPDLVEPGDLTDTLVALVVTALTFGGTPANGLHTIERVRRDSRPGALAVLTDADERLTELARDIRDLYPDTTFVHTGAPVHRQLDRLRRAARGERVEPDDALAALVDGTPNPLRTPESFSRLVIHLGHAKLWSAVVAAGPEASYQDIAELSGLRINAVRNYRAQLLPELANHGLDAPTMREMRRFARRCWPLLGPHVEARLGGLRHLPTGVGSAGRRRP